MLPRSLIFQVYQLLLFTVRLHEASANPSAEFFNMAELQQIHHNLSVKTDLVNTLKSLGDLLREEQWRSNEACRPSITQTLELVKLSNEAASEGLRVLVNYTADNDENRRFMTSESEQTKAFWNWAVDLLGKDPVVSQRVVILMSQFIHNVSEEDSTKLTAFLGQFTKQLVNFLAQNEVEEVAGVVEILAELHERALGGISMEEASGLKKSIVGTFNTGDEELMLYSAQLFHKLTAIDQFASLFQDPHCTLHLLQKVPEGEESLRTKRTLFAAHGNIFSLPGYDNWNNVEKSIRLCVDSQADLYAVAAAAIDVGNCVRSEKDQQKITKLIEDTVTLETFIGLLVQRPFGDVVQLQCVHCFTNLMLQRTSSLLAANSTALARLNKIVLDNGQFYPEIANLLFKFMKKLIRVAFVEAGGDLLGCKQVWELYAETNAEGHQEVVFALLQAPEAKHLLIEEDVGCELLAALFSVNQLQVQAHVLLEQLKAQAVFFASAAAFVAASIDRPQVDSAIVEPFAKFMESVSGAIGQQEPPESGGNIVANNSKFVAASALNFFEELLPLIACSAAIETCEQFLRSH